ncbi:MAG: TIGR00341 family protein [Bacteroides sp.]|nr:TIGR00341 family protein [Bacteroides sp.]
MDSNFANRLSGFFVNYFSLSGQLIPQQEAEHSIREGVSFKGTNIVILILAILIASLGLNVNSTAVIIGAMLISPLMGPIIGIGLGVGIHDFDLIKRSLRNLLMASAFSVIASTIYFLISPVNEQHSELLARTSPTIYDVLIGFVGGGAGIVAIASSNKGNVIPGVAIATALMPPLCTAGYGIATWQLNFFFGAGYLFVINSIYIAFATFIGVKLLKFKPAVTEQSDRAGKVMKIVYSLAILTMLPAVYLTYNMLRENKLNVEIDRFVNTECHFNGTQVLSRQLFERDGERFLQLTLIGKVLPTDSLESALESRLRFYGIENTRILILQGEAAAHETAVQRTDDSNLREIYQITGATISRQQHTIDSLKSVITLWKKHQSGGIELAPEIKVLFPHVRDLSVGPAIFADIHSLSGKHNLRSDTVSVALVSLTKPMDKEESERFAEYLKARLGLQKIEIIETSKKLSH